MYDYLIDWQSDGTLASIHQREATKARALAAAGIPLEIVKRSDGTKGFKVIPKRWIVERTFGWLGRA